MRKCLVAFAAVLFVTSFATPTKNAVNGHYYELIHGPYTWTSARDAAAGLSYLGMQGHLATVTTIQENGFLNLLGDLQGLWIGGYQLPGSAEPDGGWVWITGEAWSYTNWFAGEPNNATTVSPLGEDKLEYFTHGTNQHRQWNDNDDSGGTIGQIGYVVEYEPTPEPSSIVAIAIGAAVIGRRYSTRKR